MLVSVVAELTVHLVGEEVQVVLLDQTSDLQQLLVGIKITRGVVGVADHDGLGAWCDGLLKFLDGRKSKTRLDVARDGDDLGIAQLGEGIIIGIIRFWDDDLVARVQAHGESHLKGLAATSGDQHLIRGDIDAVTVVVVAECPTIALNTSRVAVFQHAVAFGHLVGGIGQSLQCPTGGLNVRLTNVEMIYMDTALFGSIRKWNELPNRRLRKL